MRYIHIFVIFVLITSACTVRKSYTLRQRDEWKFDVTRTKDSIFIKTMADNSCYVDTFYKGANGYYASRSKKLFFATVDTFVCDTQKLASSKFVIYEICKVTNSQRDPILQQYPDGLYKTSVLSYEICDSNVKDLAPRLIIAYYYDKNLDIVEMLVPSVITFTKNKN